MEILFITRLFLPHVGGVEKQVNELSKKLIKRGFNVAMIPLILIIFLVAKQKKFLEKLKPVVFLNAVAVLPQIAYRPKLIVLWLMLFLVFSFKSK